jgi:hypothetical protein
VVVVLGILTGSQWRQETRRERADREQLLVESLTPLAVSIEGARSPEEFSPLLDRYRRIFAERGYRHHHLELRDSRGGVVATTLGQDETSGEDDLHGFEVIRSPLLAGGHGELHVWQDATSFEADVRRRLRDRWVKILVAALTIIASAQAAIYLLISRPLGRLVGSLGKLGMGYIGPTPRTRGAWEVRVLEWRIRRTAEELRRTVERLVAAERKALQHPQHPHAPEAALQPTPKSPAMTAARGRPRNGHLLRTYLEDLCRLMETSPRGSESAANVAAETWERWAVEAERIGAIDLKVRLEDAAMRTLAADDFDRLARRIERLTGARRTWVDERLRLIRQTLGEAGVEILALQHRVKHVAGVWRKMEDKGLELEEVADLFAFRVIVADEESCYVALGALHRALRSEPFRFKDYIARPKANGYRSIHTSVRGDDDLVFEVQIRTRAMHEEAERGAAAHWSYKAFSSPPRASARHRLTKALERLLGRSA